MNTSNEQENIEKIAFANMRKARSSLLLDHPFFASFALKLELKADANSKDLWTDGKTLAFNPMYAYALSKEMMIGAQAHEIMHLACGHHIRRNGREEQKWNLACDYAINHILLEYGFKLPENFRHDPAYKDMSVDDIYEKLLRLDDSQEVNGGAKQENIAEKTSSDEGGSSGSLDADASEIEKEQEQKNTATDDNTGEESQQNQEVNPQNLNEDTESEKTQNMSTAFQGDIKDHPTLSDENNENAQKSAEQEANIQLAQAVQSAAFSGNTPLGLLRLFKETVAPSLDWRALLQRFIENCSNGDYSWSSPNRRYIYQDIYLPSRSESRIPFIALAIDASGSIDNESLSLFCSELENILEAYDTNLLVMYHDIEVQGHALYSREDRPLLLTPQGGGGTDFRPIPKFIEEENFNPSALLWFTDLECDLFPEEPHYPVLWISIKKQDFSPPFGEVIWICP